MNGGGFSGRAAARGLTAAALLGAAVFGLSATARANDRSTDSRTWSMVGHGVAEQAGSWSLGRPSGLEGPPDTGPPQTEPPQTEPPVTEPPVTEPPATEPPQTEPPVTVPEVQTSAPASPVPEAPTPEAPTPEAPSVVPAGPSTAAPRTDPLPVTGSPTSLVLALGGLALAAGALVVGWTRRRADELIGD